MDWVQWHRKGPCDELVKETAVPSSSEKGRCCMELFKTKGILFVVNGSVDFYGTKKLYMIRRDEVEKYDMWGWETGDVRERQNLCEERPFENVAATRARRRAGTQSSAFTHFTEIRQHNPIPHPLPTLPTHKTTPLHPTVSSSQKTPAVWSLCLQPRRLQWWTARG